MKKKDLDKEEEARATLKKLQIRMCGITNDKRNNAGFSGKAS
jgi:hypothetical protein